MNKFLIVPIILFISACASQQGNQSHLEVVEPYSSCEDVGAIAQGADGTLMKCSHDEVTK